jgi:hypothetical protein
VTDLAAGSPTTPPPAGNGSNGPEEPLDPIDAMRARGKHPEVAAVLAWLIPGTGHLYAGHPIKGLVSLVLILGMFLAGLWVSRCEAVSLDGEMGHPYAFLGQVGVGLPTGLALAYTHGKLPWKPDREGDDWQSPAYVARLPQVDTGLLLTMIAGLLNLLLIHDALNGIPGALHRRLEDDRQRRRLDALRAELEREQKGPDAPPPAEPAGPAPAPEVTP